MKFARMYSETQYTIFCSEVQIRPVIRLYTIFNKFIAPYVYKKKKGEGKILLNWPAEIKRKENNLIEDMNRTRRHTGTELTMTGLAAATGGPRSLRSGAERVKHRKWEEEAPSRVFQRGKDRRKRQGWQWGEEGEAVVEPNSGEVARWQTESIITDSLLKICEALDSEQGGGTRLERYMKGF